MCLRRRACVPVSRVRRSVNVCVCCQATPSQERKLQRTLSITDSVAEYFDASEEVCESLSENEASDESGLSDVTTSNSEPEDGHGTSACFPLIFLDIISADADMFCVYFSRCEYEVQSKCVERSRRAVERSETLWETYSSPGTQH